MERARTMVFTVREAHGEVSGSVREPLLSRLRREGLSGGFCRGARTDFLRFLRICGVPWETIFDEQVSFFLGVFFSHFWDHFWEGPAAGAWLTWVLRICRISN